MRLGRLAAGYLLGFVAATEVLLTIRAVRYAQRFERERRRVLLASARVLGGL